MRIRLKIPRTTLLAALGLAAVPFLFAHQIDGSDQISAFGTRDVLLASNLADTDLIQTTATLSAGGYPGVFLLNDAGESTNRFLADLKVHSLKEVAPSAAHRPQELWQRLFATASDVVVCPESPRDLLLQAACFAGTIKAPLYLLTGDSMDCADLRSRLETWNAHRIFALGGAANVCRGLGSVAVIELADAHDVRSAHIRKLNGQSPITTLVVCNPTDVSTSRGRISALAPWIALKHRAALLMTNESGSNVAELVNSAVKQPELSQVENVILAGTLKAIPTEHRPNPVPGKDAQIEMEPLTPSDSSPFTFAVGRVFHEDLGVVALLIARDRLLQQASEQKATAPRALVVSNPGGGLSLLETFSRNTTMELRNCGFSTTARFDSEVERDEIRRLLPEQDIFLWEGHYRTMVDQFGLPKWTEPLRPSLIFLQSCLALNEAEAQPLLRRGAIGVIGSSTRTYSGSGGAFTLAFFDALMYEHQSLGGALRQAKNFLLAYTILKEKRLGENAKLAGANLRSAWAFTLWGDPTVHLPLPSAPAEPLSAVQCSVQGKSVVVRVPETTYPGVHSDKYRAQMWPNCRLAGLVSKEINEDEKRLVPLIFEEVRLRGGPAEQTPHLTTKLPAKHWVFCWDARRRAGYLLIVPRKTDQEIRFHVAWD
jgi:hypothetical protein